MNNFLVKKDINSHYWSRFENKFWVIEYPQCDYLGVINNNFVTFDTIGTVPDKSMIISLKEWYIFDYLNFPELFIFKADKDFYSSDSIEFKNFLKWFSEVSGFVLGKVQWKFFYRDKSLGANGYNIAVREYNLPNNLTEISKETILNTFENEI